MTKHHYYRVGEDDYCIREDGEEFSVFRRPSYLSVTWESVAKGLKSREEAENIFIGNTNQQKVYE